MISLKEYIEDVLLFEASLLDDFSKLDKNALKAIKEQVKNWVKTDFKKSGGRVKIEQNNNGKIAVIYEGQYAIIDFSNIPESVMINIKCQNVTVENSSKPIFNYFEKIDCEYLYLEKCNCSFGDTMEESNIDTINISKSDIIKSDEIKNIKIESLFLNDSECDLRCFKNNEDMILNVSSNKSITLNLPNINFKNISVSKRDFGWPTYTLKGNYSVDYLNIYMARVNGNLPKVINKLKDSHYLNVNQFKHIKTLVYSWMPFADTREELFKNLKSGDLKIDKVIHYQHPYGEIKFDKFILDMQEGFCIGHSSYSDEKGSARPWSNVNMSQSKFKQWVSNNQSYDVKKQKNDGYDIYIIVPKDDLIPVAYYISKNGEFGAADEKLISQ